MGKSATRCCNGNLLTDHKDNPRMFQKIIKSIFARSKVKTFQLSVTFSSKSDQNNDVIKANSFCKNFSNIVTCLREKFLPLCNLL